MHEIIQNINVPMCVCMHHVFPQLFTKRSVKTFNNCTFGFRRESVEMFNFFLTKQLLTRTIFKLFSLICLQFVGSSLIKNVNKCSSHCFPRLVLQWYGPSIL